MRNLFGSAEITPASGVEAEFSYFLPDDPFIQAILNLNFQETQFRMFSMEKVE